MSYLTLPADVCNPDLPGCQPETTDVGAIAMLAVFAVLLVIAGVVVLIAFLVYRRRAPGASTDAGQAPAGWHPDPTGQSQWRWWDGQAWTDTVSDGGPGRTEP